MSFINLFDNDPELFYGLMEELDYVTSKGTTVLFEGYSIKVLTTKTNDKIVDGEHYMGSSTIYLLEVDGMKYIFDNNQDSWGGGDPEIEEAVEPFPGVFHKKSEKISFPVVL